ncbi:mucin-5AC-like [Homarus americanus]|uniref:mucin-5AC-like n=1 Tax=Homarus americanus TaxID=6706 RepID=UPI001C444EE1|nr:mucin-5AC-like [Homarus americanus]
MLALRNLQMVPGMARTKVMMVLMTLMVDVALGVTDDVNEPLHDIEDLQGHHLHPPPPPALWGIFKSLPKEKELSDSSQLLATLTLGSPNHESLESSVSTPVITWGTHLVPIHHSGPFLPLLYSSHQHPPSHTPSFPPNPVVSPVSPHLTIFPVEMDSASLTTFHYAPIFPPASLQYSPEQKEETSHSSAITVRQGQYTTQYSAGENKSPDETSSPHQPQGQEDSETTSIYTNHKFKVSEKRRSSTSSSLSLVPQISEDDSEQLKTRLEPEAIEDSPFFSQVALPDPDAIIYPSQVRRPDTQVTTPSTTTTTATTTNTTATATNTTASSTSPGAPTSPGTSASTFPDPGPTDIKIIIRAPVICAGHCEVPSGGGCTVDVVCIRGSIRFP